VLRECEGGSSGDPGGRPPGPARPTLRRARRNEGYICRFCGAQIIRVVCVSFAKQFNTTYTRLVTSSVLAARPWVTGSPDQIPDLPLDAVGILEDSDHLHERSALVLAVLEHSKSHGGRPVVPLHIIRPELITYWNRVGKAGTDQIRQYLASVRVNDAQ
jgi:hypothetical protein